MPYPKKLLNEGEELALDLRPHWWFFSKHILTGDPAVHRADPDRRQARRRRRTSGLLVVWAIVALVVGGLARRSSTCEWNFTHFVVTDDRVIYRTGVLSKRGVEIPMERINNINFHQGICERIIGAGDLDIESAGKDGQSHFDDVWHPDGVQQELYRQMEANAKKRAAGAIRGAAPAAAPRRARAADDSRAAAAARRPARPGRDHRRRVRDEEGAAARAHVRRRAVVSLVPSATETLVALGVAPVGVHAVLRSAPGVPTVGGTKNVDVDAVVALAPDLVVVNDEENRIEDADALAARGLALHSMSPRSVADVGPAVGALAAAVGVDPPAPFDAWDELVDAHAHDRRGCRRSFPIWRRPWMSLAADTYGSSLLAHVGITNVFGERRRSLSRGGAGRGRGARRPTSCCCRASRTRSPSATRSRCAPRCPARARRSSTAATCSGGGSALRPRPIRAPWHRLMARVRVRVDDLERGDLPALSVKTGVRVREPGRDRVATGAAPLVAASGAKIAAIVPLEPRAGAKPPAC